MGEPAGHPFRGNQWTNGKMGYNLQMRVSTISYTAGGMPTAYANRSGPMASREEEMNYAIKKLGQKHLNRDLTPEIVGRMAGAPPGADVLIEEAGAPHVLIVTTRTKTGYWSQRTIDLKKKHIENEESKVPETERGQGIGMEILSRQVESAREMGMHTIGTYAAGRGKGIKGGGKSGEYNGYYTWPRMGFLPELQGQIGSHGTNVTDMHGNKLNMVKMMGTSEGRKYWKDNGQGFNATFDLRPGSMSSRIHDKYKEEKAKAKSAPKPPAWVPPAQRPGYVPPRLSDGSRA
jgi:predicted GNAT family acetyltransferase